MSTPPHHRSPATARSGRRSSWSSFLSGAALLITAAVSTYSIRDASNKNLDFATAEIAGLRFLRPVVRLLIDLPAHAQHLIAQDAANTLKVSHDIDAALAEITAATARDRLRFHLDATALALTKRSAANPATLLAQWSILKSQTTLAHAKPTAGHAEFLTGVSLLIAHVGDKSNLVLDPDIDTYYLMDLTVLALPAHFERLSRLPPWNLRGARDDAEKSNVRLLAGMMREVDLGRIVNAANAVHADDEFNHRATAQTTGSPAAAVSLFEQQCATLTRELAREPAGPEAIAFASATQAAAWNVWLAAADQLDRRLQLRAEKLSAHRAKLLVSTTLGFLLCLAVLGKMIWQDRHSWKHRRELDEKQLTLDEDMRLRHAAEHRTHLIVDTALDAVVVINSAGLILEWNTQAEQTFGWSHAEARGLKLSDLIVPPAMRASAEAGIKNFLSTGQGQLIGVRVELQASKRDGREIPVELAVNPLKVGSSWEFSAFIRDISARKEAEADLIAAKDDAELASSRLQDIVSEVMVLAEEAKAANKAKSEFLATMSHEIRTPMNGVIGMSELLLDSSLDAEQREWTHALRSSGDALMGIINDILDFSKIEAGKMELELASFDPRRAAHDAVEWLSPKANEKQIALSLTVAENLPPSLMGDAARCRQVIVNLVGNAVKFTASGTVTISMSWEFVPSWEIPNPSDRELVVRVIDTGIGIGPDKIDRLFQSFTQADSSTTRKYGGTGLGLAISKQLVELMGGRIGVESVAGRGSTFHFSLPLKVAAATPLNSKELGRTRFPVNLPAQAGAGPEVLIADDNEINILLGREILHKIGCNVTVAANGKEALALVNETTFALVLMDCRMPEMDGFEATQEIRRLEAASGGRHLPIIALTANATEGDREKCLAAGMDDYLSKPFRRVDMERVIKRWSSRSA